MTLIWKTSHVHCLGAGSTFKKKKGDLRSGLSVTLNMRQSDFLTSSVASWKIRLLEHQR